jgi:hypothetical protein
MAKQSKKVKPGQAMVDQNPDRLRLIELEEQICSWKHSGRLWDPTDKEVAAALKERDNLWNALEPQSPLECKDVDEDEWDRIDREVKEEAEKEPYDPSKNF